MACAASRQRPGGKGVFIRGMSIPLSYTSSGSGDFSEGEPSP